jgi:hypothetical protein
LRDLKLVEPTESAVVSGLYVGLLAGRTLRGMALDLTERGVPSPKGRAGSTRGVIEDLLETPSTSERRTACAISETGRTRTSVSKATAPGG